jgi:hypothetical protein
VFVRCVRQMMMLSIVDLQETVNGVGMTLSG